MTSQEKGLMKDLGPHPRFGGADNFYRVIQEEIKPKVAKLATVDQSRDILVGWSLGGLFVTHALLEHPGDYKTFVALSPSLWRTDRAVFDEIVHFDGQIVADGVAPGLFLGVGGREEEAPFGFLANEFTHDELVAAVSYAKMVGNLKDLSYSLQPFFEERRLPFASKVFDGETHNSVPWTAVNPVLSFALSK
jgi:predicted alpha/beta superfamily hydrolase